MVYWKHRELFSKLIIVLGGFHLLREQAIQSEIVAKGSIDRVMFGKHYSRAVRLHKVTYEALMRLLVQALKPL